MSTAVVAARTGTREAWGLTTTSALSTKCRCSGGRKSIASSFAGPAPLYMGLSLLPAFDVPESCGEASSDDMPTAVTLP